MVRISGPGVKERWREVEAFFEERPIWSKGMIYDRLEGKMDSRELRAVLLQQCYRFRDGQTVLLESGKFI